MSRFLTYPKTRAFGMVSGCVRDDFMYNSIIKMGIAWYCLCEKRDENEIDGTKVPHCITSLQRFYAIFSNSTPFSVIFSNFVETSINTNSIIANSPLVTLATFYFIFVKFYIAFR